MSVSVLNVNANEVFPDLDGKLYIFPLTFRQTFSKHKLCMRYSTIVSQSVKLASMFAYLSAFSGELFGKLSVSGAC